MSSNKLKWLALILMLIDHLGSFVPGLPIWFRWIGRLSAPLFLFCCAWGFDYTKSRIKYLIRLYLASIAMAVIQVILNIENNFFRTLFSLCLILYVLDTKRSKKERIKYIAIYIVYQLVSIVLSIIVVYQGYDEFLIFSIFSAVLGNVLGIEGGFFVVILGILFYRYKTNKKKLIASFILYDICYFIASTTIVIPRIVWELCRMPVFTYLDNFSFFEVIFYIMGVPLNTIGGSPLYESYQWMMIFSLIPMLLYNGEQGKKHKWVFYVFYPLHIVILCMVFGTH